MNFDPALHRLQRVCSARAELKALGQVTERLIRLLATTAPGPLKVACPLTLDEVWELADASLLNRRWSEICQIFGADDPASPAGRLNQAVVNGQISVREQLWTLRHEGPRSFADVLRTLRLDVALGFTVLRMCSLGLFGALTISGNGPLETVTAGFEPGACRVCGNEPLLAELRGLEQLRWLRCGWCAAEWEVDRIECPFCGNRDHRSLRDLAIDDGSAGPRLSVCDACGRWLPTLPTLARLSPPELLVADLETMHLRLLGERIEEA